MLSQVANQFGILLLRVSLGVVFLAHSVILKWQMYGLPGTADFFQSLGLPGALAYWVFGAEVLGGVLLILGVQTRWVALTLLPIPLGAVWVHSGNGWLFTNQGGGWEYPLFLSVLVIIQALLGDGSFALSRSGTPRARQFGVTDTPESARS